MASDIKYSLCAIDLDETLLGPDHTISDANKLAIYNAASRGATIIIASGRMHEATLRYVTQLDLTGPVISYNGALIKLPNTGEEWLHERVPADIAVEVMHYCSNRGLQLNFYYNGLIYTAAVTRWLELYHTRTGSPYVVEPDMLQSLAGIMPTKLIIVDTPQFTDSLLPEFRDRYNGLLYVTKTTDEYLEMMPLNANKGLALECVANRLGIPSSETVAVGDSYNDAPMLKWAGTGVAVANAKPELLAMADRIVPASSEDGVAVLLNDLFA